MCIAVPSVLRASARLSIFAIGLTACGGNGNVATNAPPPLSLQGTPGTLPAARTTFCFTPSAQAQTVAIPNTGGVTGTLDVAASPSGDTSCSVSVTVATGSSSTLVPATRARAQLLHERRTLATSAPILQISVSNAFSNNVLMYGVTLNTPPNLVFPNGTYYALLTYNNLPPVQLTFIGTNGVLTLVTHGPPLIFFPGSTAVLSLYAQGVVPAGPPSASPSPVPSPSATPTPPPSPTPAPTFTPTPPAGTFGFPPPPAGTTIGTFSYVYKGTCPPGYPYQCSGSGSLVQNQDASGPYADPGFPARLIFTGDAILSFNLGSFIAAAWTVNCPSNVSVTVSASSISATIPPPPPGGSNPSCSVVYTTLPPGQSGSYYTETIHF